VRAAIPGPGPDRWLAPELAEVEALIASGAALEAVEGAIGSLE
jgi:histidine ammonia-lyase